MDPIWTSDISSDLEPFGGKGQIYSQINTISQLITLANLSRIVSSLTLAQIKLLTLPPILSLASKMVTWKPFSRRTSAHLSPEIPAPTIPTWTFFEDMVSGGLLVCLEQTNPIFKTLKFRTRGRAQEGKKSFLRGNIHKQCKDCV